MGSTKTKVRFHYPDYHLLKVCQHTIHQGRNLHLESPCHQQRTLSFISEHLVIPALKGVRTFGLICQMRALPMVAIRSIRIKKLGSGLDWSPFVRVRDRGNT